MKRAFRVGVGNLQFLVLSLISLGSFLVIRRLLQDRLDKVCLEKGRASLLAQLVKNLPIVLETWVRSLGWEDPLEKEMTTHFSIIAWKIPWTEEPSALQSMGLQRIGHDCSPRQASAIHEPRTSRCSSWI